MTTWKSVAFETPQPYKPIQNLQHRLVEARRNGILETDLVLCLEHTPVFTLGRHGGQENLKISPAFLQHEGIPIVKTERGGDITFHGPGQLVAYLILDLRKLRLRISALVATLETAMIQTSKDCDVPATRNPLNRGIWVEERKLGSIGIAIRHGITYHGLALNVNISLEPFSWIFPCGLSNTAMTSLKEETGCDRDITDIRETLLHHIGREFGVELQTWKLQEFLKEYPISGPKPWVQTLQVP